MCTYFVLMVKSREEVCELDSGQINGWRIEEACKAFSLSMLCDGRGYAHWVCAVCVEV